MELLEKDHTFTSEQLSQMLDSSKEEIEREIARLKQEKIIVKYQTIINWEKVDADIVTAIIDVKITPQREVGFDSLAERIYRFPEVRNLYLMSGTYDLSVMVQEKSLKDVARFVATKLAPIEGVLSTTTHFMLKRYKDDGVIIDDQEKDRRLAVTP